MNLKSIGLVCLLSLSMSKAWALNVGEPAPLFTLKNQEGKEFSLANSKGKNWTLVYFYPKADTPGCTAQACAFRDPLEILKKENTVVVGISTNSVADLQKFKDKYQLNFELLSDEDGKVCSLYDSKIPVLLFAKRHTFIVDPNLIVRYVETDVDPALDAKRMAEKILDLQKTTGPQSTITPAPTTNTTKPTTTK
jgi:peroxiredoxin Q/BCP